jgi:hypothetical protein
MRARKSDGKRQQHGIFSFVRKSAQFDVELETKRIFFALGSCIYWKRHWRINYTISHNKLLIAKWISCVWHSSKMNWKFIKFSPLCVKWSRHPFFHDWIVPFSFTTRNCFCFNVHNVFVDEMWGALKWRRKWEEIFIFESLAKTFSTGSSAEEMKGRKFPST